MDCRSVASMKFLEVGDDEYDQLAIYLGRLEADRSAKTKNCQPGKRSAFGFSNGDQELPNCTPWFGHTLATRRYQYNPVSASG